MTLCECGCGEEVKKGNRFINGHHPRGRKHTDETKSKMSKAQKGRKLSDVTKKKMSEAHKGKISTFKDKKHTDETKKKISNINRGRKLSADTKRKMGEAKKGKRPFLGYQHTDETKRKLSEACRGENHYNWRGGISFGEYCPKFNGTIKEEVREKYGRKCVICGKTEDDNGRKLDVHHIDYNKLQGCEEHEWKLVPLCRRCHSKTNHHREYWENLIMEKLGSIV